jgi:serine protease
MTKLKKLLLIGSLSALCVVAQTSAGGVTAEWNPVNMHPVDIGPQAGRLIVGFKASEANSQVKMITVHALSRRVAVRVAQTTGEDARALLNRTGLAAARSRQVTPNMHVVFLSKTLYGADLENTLTKLRSDPAVAFADVDARRYPHATPNDPLFQPGTNNTGQWFMLTPTTTLPTSDWSATDAVSAWGITTGSTGTVIADVDSGFRFDHPDLLRAGFGGRLLPGYDFVSDDLNSSTGADLGTFLVANDGDGWDPDPSDPGDWINATDQMNTALFPSSKCTVSDSSWHGTRVAGVLGAITNNGVGVAGMTWNPYILPVRALGKCGGYDSDIMTGMQWAAGLSVSGVPDNPYPADIINLSLGGTGSCPGAYQSVINNLLSMGVLIVASAGNESGPVDVPGNCAGVLAVAGLRNVGTKVGYSSLGSEVGISAPAGNCVNSSGACLRSIDTTFNTGLTTPSTNSYTDQINPNLGTSFSAPIVSGVAALMRAVNANLTPAQLITRMKASASPFPPNTTGVPVCPNADPTTKECACTSSECGAGMVNAFSAVKAALAPIAAVSIPSPVAMGSLTFDARGSVAACNASVASYAWSASGGVSISAGANAAQVSVTWSGAGTLTLQVTDSAGKTDSAVLTFTTTSVTTTAPSSAGTSATACPTAFNFTVAPPTLTPSFSPTSVATNTNATLTLALGNSNGFDLTQSGVSQAIPAGLTVDATSVATTCTGANKTVAASASTLTLGNANIPANGSCTVTVSVKGSATGSFTANSAAGALSTGPAGANSASGSATLTVTAAAASSRSGGGALGGVEFLLLGAALLLPKSARKRRV